MKHTIAKSIAASSLIAPLANATISIVVPNETITAGESLYVDFSAGTTSNSSGGSDDIRLDFSSGESEKPAISSFGNYRSAYAGSFVARYDAGDALNFTNTTSSVKFEYNDTGGPWAGGAIGYAAVQNLVTSKEIWLHIDYNDVNDTLTLLSFAYADASDNITAGQQIPEPAQTAALMAVIAGSAAAFRRRRRLIDSKN